MCPIDPVSCQILLPKYLDSLLQRLESLFPSTRSSERRAENKLRPHLPARVYAPLLHGFEAELGLVVLQITAETFDRQGSPDWKL